MRITVALCWFQEPPEFLERLGRSLADFASDCVTLDGRWRLFGEDGAWSDASPAEQHERLAAGLAAAGVHHIALPHDGEPFESQVAKRDRLYREAIARTDCDWLFLLDGDEYLDWHADDLCVRLAALDQDVATVKCVRTHYNLRTVVRHPRRIFRASAIGHVMETHSGIVTPDGRWLSGPRRITTETPADLSDHVTIAHEVLGRGKRRNSAMKSYYNERRERRVEVFS